MLVVLVLLVGVRVLMVGVLVLLVVVLILLVVVLMLPVVVLAMPLSCLWTLAKRVEHSPHWRATSSGLSRLLAILASGVEVSLHCS